MKRIIKLITSFLAVSAFLILAYGSDGGSSSSFDSDDEESADVEDAVENIEEALDIEVDADEEMQEFIEAEPVVVVEDEDID